MADKSTNVLVLFYSRDGAVEALAQGIAEGAREAGAEVRLRRVPDIVPPAVMAHVPGWEERSKKMIAAYGAATLDDVAWADAVLFGTPTRFGNVSAELKAFVDSLGGLWFQGKLNGKIAGVFVSTGGPHGGNESTITSFYIPLAHLGFIIVPNGYTHPRIMEGHGTPYGSSMVAGPSNQPPTPADLEVARHQGKRTAEVAAVTKSLRA